MGIIIHELQDLRYLEWSKIRHSSGTAGSFLKAEETMDGRKRYYKLSDYDSFKGIVGHECINEIVVDRLLMKLGIEHLEYTLVHARIVIDGKEYETYVCRSDDFKLKGESKIALDTFYMLERQEGEAPLEFCYRMGWKKYCEDMLLIDYLVLNRDRHGANIEILKNRQKRSIRPAPLFDHGLSLVFCCHNDSELEAYDTTEDKRVQCFIGGNSAKANLLFIPDENRRELPAFDAKLKELLFSDLIGIMSQLWIDKVWNMLVWRADEYKDLRTEE